jgi:signal transduction histidine kinase
VLRWRQRHRDPRGQAEGHLWPFYTTKAKGTGLGLVIVRKMLAKMNGTIDIQSRTGEGTTVTITLPEDSHEER